MIETGRIRKIRSSIVSYVIPDKLAIIKLLKQFIYFYNIDLECSEWNLLLSFNIVCVRRYRSSYSYIIKQNVLKCVKHKTGYITHNTAYENFDSATQGVKKITKLRRYTVLKLLTQEQNDVGTVL